MTVMNREWIDTLTSQADHAVDGMKRAAQGKAPEAPAQTDASTFLNLANLIAQLTDVVRKNEIERQRLAAAIDRVANLKVRSAAELIEQKKWQALVLELQSVAQDALAVRA